MNVVQVDTGAGVVAASVSGEGPDLLALHGGPGLSDYMSLLDAETVDWRVLRYQQRGLAPSTAEGPFSISQHVADAVAVLDACEVERAVLVGHSWGGHLALQIATAHVDRVSAVIVIDGLGSTGDGGSPALGAELRTRLAPEARVLCEELDRRQNAPNATDTDALASLTLLWPSYFADPPSAPKLPDGLRLSIPASSRTMASALEQLEDGSFAERLQQVQVPVVVLVGEMSPMPTSVGEQTAALAPRGELVVIPGAGHLPWHEQPGCVADALRPFRAAT